MIWIERLEQVAAGRGLAEAVAWLASPELAEAEAERPTPEDLADAAPLGPVQGAARLQRRTLLRALASRALNCPPRGVAFARDGEGRARLTTPTLAFASAAGRTGWHAVALGPRPLGVDVEEAALAPPLPLDLIVLPERARLAALPASERAQAFARLWVAREAYAKASGVPLEDALASVSRPSTFFAAGPMIATVVEL